MSAEFLLTSLVVVLVPGTGVIYTVSTGLFQGWRASFAAALGCTFGIVPHLAASIMGLMAVLHLSALAFQVLKYCGAAYLLYLAWVMWRETGALNFNSSTRGRSVGPIVARGFLINILNPKLSIFFLAFLPQFIAPGQTTPMIQMLVLSGTFMVMTLVVFMFYGLFAHAVRYRILNSPALTLGLQRTSAGLFAFLGARLALSER